MMSLNKFLFLPIFALLLMLAGGCDLADSKEGAHPLFKKGRMEQEKGNYAGAINYYKRYLAVRPNSGKTHLLLATIYDENMDSQVNAIYHYEEFIRISKNSNEAQNVRKWIATAKHKYYLKMKSTFNDPEDLASLQDELVSTNQKCAAMLEEKKKLMAFFEENKKNLLQLNTQNNILAAEKEKYEAELAISQEKLKQLDAYLKQYQEKTGDELAKAKAAGETAGKELALLKEQHRNLQLELEKSSRNKIGTATAEQTKTEPITMKTADSIQAQPKADKPIPQIAAESSTIQTQTAITTAPSDAISQSEMSKTHFYTVKNGDTLSKISKQFYGTTKYYRQIMDENKLGADAEKQMKPGVVLKIPPLKNN
jgi:nucleoid-associated protein YgaU